MFHRAHRNFFQLETYHPNSMSRMVRQSRMLEVEETALHIN